MISARWAHRIAAASAGTLYTYTGEPGTWPGPVSAVPELPAALLRAIGLAGLGPIARRA